MTERDSNPTQTRKDAAIQDESAEEPSLLELAMAALTDVVSNHAGLPQTTRSKLRVALSRLAAHREQTQGTTIQDRAAQPAGKEPESLADRVAELERQIQVLLSRGTDGNP